MSDLVERTSVTSLRSRWDELVELTAPAGMRPVLILLLAASLERFLVTSVAVLTPNIRDSFHLSNQTVVTAETLISILPAVASPLVGYWADRTNRIRLAQWGTVAVGVVGIGMGLAPGFWLLSIFFFGAGLGQLVNYPTHSSLIVDYYPPRAMGVTWTIYLFATTGIPALAGPIAGTVGSAAGWRAVFFVVSVPVIVTVFVLGRLRDPGRGASLGLAEQLARNEERASFWEGFRRLKSIRSLRRTWWAATFFGGGVVAFLSLQSIFFKDVYHFGTGARGLITLVYGLAGLAGTVLGGRYVQRYLRETRAHLLPVVNGLMVVEFGVGVALMGLVPNRWVAVLMLGVAAVGAAGFAPAYNTMIGLVTSPRLRGQAFSWSLIWVTLGAVIVAPTIGGIANHHERAATYVLGALMVMAGLIEVTARKFVPRDIEQAAKVQEAADSDALLAVRGLEVAYPGNLQVLFGVDLEVREGEIVALLGTNGAGKSTFLRAVAGLIDPIGGSVYLDGRDVSHADATTKALLGMALAPGDRGVFPGLTVEENLQIATWTFRSDQATVDEATARVLGYFPVLRERRSVAAGNLSGGEQQMLVLAQALMGRPKILMIDELTLGLSPVVVEQLLGVVRSLSEDGLTILLVEQSVNVALTLAKRAVFMEKGEIRFSGPTEELFSRPDVLRSVFLEGTAQSMGNGEGAPKPTRRGRPRTASTNGSRSTVLELRGITRRFGGVTAVDEVDLDLYDGQILGLMGPNGAGKTTLFDIVSGFVRPDSGRIALHGEDITHLPPDTRSRLGLGRSFQDSRLFPAMTVLESIKVALERHVEVRDPLAAALRLPAVAESEAVVTERVEELIELLGLGAYRNKFVSEISTGTRRMVDLACILAQEPTVILFDEPSSGIAQRETEQLGPVLRQVKELTGSSLMVIEHDMGLLRELADEVVALDLGRTVARGEAAQVLSDPRVVASYLGTSEAVLARSGSRLGAGNGNGRRRSVTARPAPAGGRAAKSTATNGKSTATNGKSTATNGKSTATNGKSSNSNNNDNNNRTVRRRKPSGPEVR